ncbi:GNAT family N-acetyltransferase [Janibacter melonis]|uniref:GNAT family N-acetyltransferase n=1 Tax=Janibacter melonis TaxID=262209 RepID=UPI0017487217|nr:GNAT family N-acetyltransferase [Janibacter melonis]
MIISRNAVSVDQPAAPDIYFSSRYAGACEQESPGRWLSLGDPDGSWQMPLVLSEIPDVPGQFDAASPYGYSGVFVSPEMSLAEQRVLWTESLDALRTLGVVSLFLRHSSLVPTIALEAVTPFKEVVANHPTVAVDIQDADRMWEALAGRTRTAVRKARKSALEVGVRRARPHDFARGSSFRGLYESTMERVGAAPRYFFTDAYYQALHEGLDQDLMIVEVHADDGSLGAAALLLRHEGLLHYHLSGSDPSHARLGANNLMIWGAMVWASEAAVRTFHLGGGVNSDDALIKFKRSFGGRDLKFRATGHIVNPEAYSRLTTEAQDPSGGSQGFFPAYRGPST